MNNKTVLVGLSGGVDSSVAAYLLKSKGYNVIGITMQIWCEDESVVSDAKKVAEFLDIPFYIVEYKEIFEEKIINNFVSEYISGRTPNPCVACNRLIKWAGLLDMAKKLDAGFVATGHYADIVKLDNGRYSVKMSATSKDQSYALYNLTQEQLEKTIFPLSECSGKDEIRQIALDAKIPVAKKPDSMEICFVEDNDYISFIEKRTNVKDTPGNFVDTKGNVLGMHQGISHYTIGQRKGLGIALGEPAFVVKIDPKNNEVVLGKNDEVFSSRLSVINANYMGKEKISVGDEVVAKIRYNHSGDAAVVTEADKDSFSLEFKKPVRAITPGQACVIYDEGICLGGGTIL